MLIPPSEDLAKALKRLGYPEVEEGIKPSGLLQKAMTCITKRQKKLAEFLPSEGSDNKEKDNNATDEAKEPANKETLKNKTCP